MMNKEKKVKRVERFSEFVVLHSTEDEYRSYIETVKKELNKINVDKIENNLEYKENIQNKVDDYFRLSEYFSILYIDIDKENDHLSIVKNGIVFNIIKEKLEDIIDDMKIFRKNCPLSLLKEYIDLEYEINYKISEFEERLLSKYKSKEKYIPLNETDCDKSSKEKRSSMTLSYTNNRNYTIRVNDSYIVNKDNSEDIDNDESVITLFLNNHDSNLILHYLYMTFDPNILFRIDYHNDELLISILNLFKNEESIFRIKVPEYDDLNKRRQLEIGE